MLGFFFDRNVAPNVARKEENGDLNSKRHFIAKFRPRFLPRSESDLSLPNKWVIAQAVVR